MASRSGARIHLFCLISFRNIYRPSGPSLLSRPARPKQLFKQGDLIRVKFMLPPPET